MRNYKGKNNFSLVELIIASVLLIIALIGIPTFYVANHRNLRTAYLKRLATWQATDKLEQLKSESYGTLASGSDNVQLGWVEADRVWNVEEYEPPEDEPDMEYKNIKVTVSWGGNTKVSLATYIAQY